MINNSQGYNFFRWIPVLIFCLASLGFISSLIDPNNFLFKIAKYFFIISGVLLFGGAIFQFYKGNGYFGIFQMFVLIVGFIGISFLTSFIIMFGPDTDTFADNLQIPQDIKFEYPIAESIRNDSLLAKEFKRNEFQLYHSFQPGLYNYDVWIKTRRKGTAYLKAFEITQEIQLSNPKLLNRSGMVITNTEGKYKRFQSENHFTIYEGDWGKPYGARFELWFIPENESRAIKIREKNYIIEGWMR